MNTGFPSTHRIEFSICGNDPDPLTDRERGGGGTGSNTNTEFCRNEYF